MEPGRGISNALGIAALLLVGGLVCGLHGYGLDAAEPADQEKALKESRFAVTMKIRRREPLTDAEKAIMEWRPGDPLPEGPPSWPWYLVAGVLSAGALSLGAWASRRPSNPVPS